MKIPFASATAPQLRQYLKEQFNIDRHPNSGVPSLLKQIQEELGVKDEEFELIAEPEERAPASPVHTPAGMAPSEAKHGNTGEAAFTPEMVVSTLVAAGMPEDEAREFAGLKVRKAENTLAGGPESWGPEHDQMFVTVHIAREKGKFGNEPVFVSVNGDRIDIPRGIDWPIRVPFFLALLDAVEIRFDQVRTGNAHEVKLVPRTTLSYPIQLITPIPYSRDMAVKVAKEAAAELADSPIKTLGQLAAG